MQDIRLIALDMDGTVLDDKKQISARTMAALRAAAARGVAVVPATGRTISGVPEEFMALRPRYALGSNGATVRDLEADRLLVELPFDTAQALDIYRIVERYPSMISVFVNGETYTDAANAALADRYSPPTLLPFIRRLRRLVPDMRALIRQPGAHVEKFSILYPDFPLRDAAWAAVEQAFPEVEITSSVGSNLEINAAGVHKGRGLAELVRILGLQPDQVMACGDSGNDLAMIEFAGLGVAMGNAEPAVKAAAQYITLDNEHDGVAAAVEKFVLGKS